MFRRASVYKHACICVCAYVLQSSIKCCFCAFPQVLDKILGDQHHYVHLRMSVRPDICMALFKHVEVAHSRDSPIHHLKPHQLKALENGIKSALANGMV